MAQPHPGRRRRDSRSSGRAWAVGGLAVALLAVGVGFFAGRSPTRAGERARVDDPERFVAVALELIETGRPERLTDLIHAESPEMRAVLDGLGRALASAADLAEALAERFPDESSRLAASAFERWDARRPMRDGPTGDTFAAILVDPFGWVRNGADRLAVEPLSDDARAITIDGAPALGVGLVVRRFDAGWQIVIPSALPGVGAILPRSAEEWRIAGSMAAVLENALRDLAREVRSGRVRSVEDAARRAGEMAWGPLVMTWIAYQRAREISGGAGQVR